MTRLKPKGTANRPVKEDRGWMIILRADIDFKSDGGEDEVFVMIYRDLDKAKEECRITMKQSFGDDVETDVIEWGEDQESTPRKLVYFGRPKAEVDGYFQIYQVWIE